MNLPAFARTIAIALLLAATTHAMTVNMALPYKSVTSPPRSKQPVIFYAPEQPNFLFEHGSEIHIQLQTINRPLRLEWQLCRNRVNTPLMTGTTSPNFDESFLVSIPTKALPPAFYDLHVKIVFSEKESLDAITVFGWKAMSEPLVSMVPDDFLAFWKQARETMSKVPLDLKFTYEKTLEGDEISAYNLQNAALPEHYDPQGEKYQKVEIYKVDFASHNGKRTYGWFAKPAGNGPFPALLILPGAGNNPRSAPVEHARHGYAALDINVHNCPADLPPDQYPSLTAVEKKPLSTPQEYGHYDVYLNAMKAVDALAQMPGVDANRIGVLGGSQGGRLSTVVAATDSRIKAAVLAITHFNNMPWHRWTDILNKAHDPGNRDITAQEVPNDLQTHIESYFDVANFAPLIRCPVLMNAGLVDPVSPPTGVYAVFRNIQAPKEMIPLPNVGHDWSPAFDCYAWTWLDKQLGSTAAKVP